MISESGAKYSFVIMDTEGSDKNGMHWWRFPQFASKNRNLYVS